MASQVLVPATVELTPLDGKRARLSVLWTNGQRGKWDGPQDAAMRAPSISHRLTEVLPSELPS